MTPAQYLNKLRKEFDTMNLITDFPANPIDRIEMDVLEGISEEESILLQTEEYESAIELIIQSLRNLNKI